MIGLFGRLEYFICKTLELVIVLGLELSLGVKNADVIQEAFQFPQLGPVLLVASSRCTTLMEQSAFLFLSWPLDELGWSAWPESFSFFCSLVSRVTTSAKMYLLVMANIAFDVLVFFMVSFQIRVRSLSPFLKNMTSGMIFLFL
jgi:hypothetical protein